MQSSPTPFGAPQRSPTLVLIPLLIILLAALALGIYFITALPIELQIGSEHYPLRTHETSVRAVLAEAGVYLEPEDVVAPALDAPLSAGLTISVTKARPVIVAADGNEIRLLTHLTDPKAILDEAGIVVLTNDKISSDGSTVSVQRSRSVTLDDNGTQRILYTTGATVAAALDESRIGLFSADQVTPPLNQMLTDDARITIKRSMPITVQVDGRTLRTRTHARTVGEALAEVGIALNGMDTSTPPGNAALTPNLGITVKRITETEEVEQVELPFNRVLTPDPTLELDQIVITQAGQVGIQEIHTRVRREDGVEVSRSAPLRWIVTPARNEQGKIGMNPILHTLETPDTKVSYWRKLTVRATAYRPATSGKLPNDPLYGVTSTGQRLAKGIVAVDPDLIPIGTELYIPGYGRAVAGDVPGNLTGLQIKLGYDDSDYIPFAGETTVYLLAPIPPIEKIAQLPLPEN
jgi:uncharacterized protein YabE (DUF348 family)